MNNKFKLSNLLKIGAFIAPVVPGFTIAHRVYLNAQNMDVWGEFLVFPWFMALVSIALFESIGVGSGYLTTRFAIDKKWIAFSVASLAMIAYIGVGLFEFGLTLFGLFFVLAPPVYILGALLEIEEESQTDKKQVEKERRAFNRQEKAKDNEARRQARYGGNNAASLAANNGNLPITWKRLTSGERAEIATMTSKELAAKYPQVAARTRRAWRARAMKEFVKEGV